MNGHAAAAGAVTNGIVAAPARVLVQMTRLCVVRRSTCAALTTAFQLACSTADSSTSGTSSAVAAMAAGGMIRGRSRRRGEYAWIRGDCHKYPVTLCIGEARPPPLRIGRAVSHLNMMRTYFL